MVEGFLVRAPIKAKPKLPQGKLHKLLITTEKLEIFSWENVYGNKKSEKLVSVLHKHIVKVDFKNPLLNTKERYCKVVYENELGVKNLLEFTVLNTFDLYRMQTGPYYQNKTTEQVAKLLQALIDPNQLQSYYSKPIDIPFRPPKNIIKLLAGLALPFITTIGWVGGFQTLFWTSLFLLFPSLIALAIDYIRLNVGWSAWLKYVAYILIFVFIFVAVVTIIFLVEYYHPFQ